MAKKAYGVKGGVVNRKQFEFESAKLESPSLNDDIKITKLDDGLHMIEYNPLKFEIQNVYREDSVNNIIFVRKRLLKITNIAK